MSCKSLVFLCVAILILFPRNAALQVPQGATQGGSMGVGAYIYLFDSNTCEHLVLPAYRSFKERSDKGPLLKLLRRALPVVSSLPVGQGLSSRSVEIYQHYIDVLRGARERGSNSLEGIGVDSPSNQELRAFVDNSVAPGLVQVFCFPHHLSIQPEQNMSNRALMKYLYSQSRWVEDYFTFAKEPSGPVPEIKVGDWSRFFSRDEIQTFDEQLSQMQRPNDDEVLAGGFDNLCALVHAAASDPNLTILMAGL